jgi:aldehyde dehydrogenase (NAD+)
MTLSFDPDRLPLPVGHFIGDRLLAAEGVIDMHPALDGQV